MVRQQAFKFALIGVINTAVDLAVFAFLLFTLNLGPILANIFAWAVAVTISYILNAHYTFQVQKTLIWNLKRFQLFAMYNLAGLVISTTLLWALEPYFAILIVKLIAIVAGFAVNFALSKFFVFRK